MAGPDADLNLVRALVYLLEERSVTNAARRAGITQPAMSRTLARLRDQLGDVLLVRTARGMELTTRAQAVLVPARQAVVACDGVLAPPRPFDPASATRTFRIAGTDFGLATLMPALVRTLRRDAPRISLVALPLPTHVGVALEVGELDLAVAFGSPKGRGMMGQPLYKDGIVCVGRAEHPVLPVLTRPRYLECDHLALSGTGAGPDAIDRVLASQRERRRVVLRTPHFLLAPAVLAATDLILTTGDRVATALAALAPLRIVPAPIDLGRITVMQFWHERDDGDDGHRWFRAEVKRAAGA